MPVLFALLLSACSLWISDDDACADGVDRVRYYADADGDGYGDPESIPVCQPGADLAGNAEDCDDTDASIGSVAELGAVPGISLWYRDADLDGLGVTGDTVLTCQPPDGYGAIEGGDCDDDNPYSAAVCAWAQLAVGPTTNCGVRTDGALSCWGSDGALLLTRAPTQVAAAKVDVSWSAACLLDTEGQVACWGLLEEYALSGYEVIDPPPGTGHVDVAVGPYAQCAVSVEGGITCFGVVAEDRGDEIISEAPTTTGWTQVSVSSYAACAVGGQGQLACWGNRTANGDSLSVLYDDVPQGAFDQVAVASDHACARSTAGEILCWGRTGAHVRDVPERQDAVDVSVSDDVSCAVYADGDWSCWGDGAAGGAQDLVAEAPEMGGTVLDLGLVSNGNSEHACALLSTGDLFCWGDDDQGQTDVPSSPTLTGLAALAEATCGVDEQSGALTCWGDAPALQTDWSDVAFGGFAAQRLCVLHAGGRVECWDLGQGTSGEALGVPDEGGFVEVESAWGLVCALDAEGAISCWSEDADSLGVSEAPTGTGYHGLDINAVPCAIDPDGAPVCWGADLDSSAWAEIITALPADLRLVSLSVGLTQICGVQDDGAIVCWGSDEDIYGEWTGVVSDTPTGDDFVQVATGGFSACALHTSGTIECWGSGGTYWPPEAPLDDDFVALRGGLDGYCAQHADGSLTCFGDIIEDLAPRTPEGTSWVGFDVGNAHACAWTATGASSCWGSFSEGYTPPGAAQDVQGASAALDAICALHGGYPVCSAVDRRPPDPLARFDALALGADHSCGVDEDGRVSCWGEDDEAAADVPDGLAAVAQVVAGQGYSCALDQAGAVSCWGEAAAAQGAPTGAWTAISGGLHHACAVDGAAQVRCWGDDSQGQATVPADLPAATAVAAGGYHTCALDPDGLPTCWGLDSYRQTRAPAVRFTSLAAGAEHTCGVRLNGLPYCWGRDLEGQSTPPD